MKTPQANGRDEKLDALLDEALTEDREGILPSSGFADSVMAAVQHGGPEALGFPWKRALPGLIAGLLAVVGFAAGNLWVLRRMPPAASAATLPGHAMVAAILSHAMNPAMSPTVVWTLTALLIPVVSLWLMRRLFFSR